MLFDHVKQENIRHNCGICCIKTENSEAAPTATFTNRVLLRNSDMLSQICSYDFNVSALITYSQCNIFFCFFRTDILIIYA